MNENKKSLNSIRKDIMTTQTILIIVIAVVLGAAGIAISLKSDSAKRDLNLRNVAESVAALSSAYKEGTDLTEPLDSLYSSLSEIDVISVIDSNGIRLYHSNHDLIGTKYEGSLPDFASHNGESYTVNDKGPSGNQRRAYAELTDAAGNPAGFVITLALRSNIRSEILHIVIIFLLVMCIALFIELLISKMISGRIKDRLLGYEPDTFSAMYTIRDNILESIDEGIIAVDQNADIQFMNRRAAAMLSDSESKEGQVFLSETDTASQNNEYGKKLLLSTVQTGIREFGVPESNSGKTDILVDKLPITDGDTIIGAAAILHDRTEYTQLMEDLSGTRYLVDSMRANNHDFTNKLHVILGLLEMEMYDEAVSYIENISIVQKETISRIMNAIDDPTIAALLIGKQARASELNIHMKITEESSCSKYDIMVPDETLVTIIGNLIDNAFDAMNQSDDDFDTKKELVFGIYSRKDALLITVEDNGPGIPKENLERIFEYGFSTKGEGRGTGLFQIRNIITNLGGTIRVQSEPGKGTSFVVCIDKRQSASSKQETEE